MSLINKAVACAIALGTLPVLGCGAMAYYLTNKNTVSSEIQYQASRATSLTDKINRFLFERYGDIQVIASLPVLNDPKFTTVMSFQEKQTVLNKYVQTYGVYDSIAAFDLNGNLIVQSSGKLLTNQNGTKLR